MGLKIKYNDSTRLPQEGAEKLYETAKNSQKTANQNARRRNQAQNYETEKFDFPEWEFPWSDPDAFQNLLNWLIAAGYNYAPEITGKDLQMLSEIMSGAMDLQNFFYEQYYNIQYPEALQGFAPQAISSGENIQGQTGEIEQTTYKEKEAARNVIGKSIYAIDVFEHPVHYAPVNLNNNTRYSREIDDMVVDYVDSQMPQRGPFMYMYDEYAGMNKYYHLRVTTRQESYISPVNVNGLWVTNQEQQNPYKTESYFWSVARLLKRVFYEGTFALMNDYETAGAITHQEKQSLIGALDFDWSTLGLDHFDNIDPVRFINKFCDNYDGEKIRIRIRASQLPFYYSELRNVPMFSSGNNYFEYIEMTLSPGYYIPTVDPQGQREPWKKTPLPVDTVENWGDSECSLAESLPYSDLYFYSEARGLADWIFKQEKENLLPEWKKRIRKYNAGQKNILAFSFIARNNVKRILYTFNTIEDYAIYGTALSGPKTWSDWTESYNYTTAWYKYMRKIFEVDWGPLPEEEKIYFPREHRYHDWRCDRMYIELSEQAYFTVRIRAADEYDDKGPEYISGLDEANQTIINFVDAAYLQEHFTFDYLARAVAEYLIAEQGLNRAVTENDIEELKPVLRKLFPITTGLLLEPPENRKGYPTNYKSDGTLEFNPS
jgi:hypothetical protein